MIVKGAKTVHGVWCVVFGLCLLTVPGGAQEMVYYEHDGTVVVEAEDFVEQIQDNTRRWYIINTTNDSYPEDEIEPTDEALEPLPEPDADKRHAHRAGGGAYIEILPDTRRTHDDRLVRGINFTNQPGRMAIISYPVHFANPGRYYVWVRAHSTGTEDNGVHVGLNGEWPATGQRIQWCEGKFQWYWSASQRTDAVHCGVPHRIYLDIEEPGLHTIQFSMREDGFEMDRWMMTTERLAGINSSMGPEAALYRESPNTAVTAETWGRVKAGEQTAAPEY